MWAGRVGSGAFCMQIASCQRQLRPTMAGSMLQGVWAGDRRLRACQNAPLTSVLAAYTATTRPSRVPRDPRHSCTAARPVECGGQNPQPLDMRAQHKCHMDILPSLSELSATRRPTGTSRSAPEGQPLPAPMCSQRQISTHLLSRKASLTRKQTTHSLPSSPWPTPPGSRVDAVPNIADSSYCYGLAMAPWYHCLLPPP